MIIGEDGYRSKILRKYHLLQVFILVVLCCLILAVSFINRNRFMNEHEEKNSVTLRYHSMVPSSHPSISFSVRNLFGKKRLNSIMHSSTMEQARLSNENLFAQNSDNNVTYCVTQETPVKWDALQFFKFGVAVVLVGLSGLFSGLTLGLLGLDKTTLDILKESGKEKHRKWAARIIPIRKRGNLLLCTLLLGNVMVNTGISVLTTDMTSGIAGFIISSAVITLFGEILPQATCSRYALAIGAHTIWLVYIFMFLLFPITFPLSFFLDRVLGKEIGTVYTKEELKKLVEIHVTTLKQESDLLEDEARILGAVLDFSKKEVKDIMTPLESTFMLELSEKLDLDTMTKIWQTGHSRIPVYKNTKDEIVGILFTKDLVLINPEEGVPLSTVLTFYGREVIKVFPDTKLDEMLKIFKTGRSHIAIVHDVYTEADSDPVYKTIGLVSLEDVIEELIKDEIVDETDVYTDNQSKKKVLRESNRVEISLFSGKGKKQRVTPKQVVAISSYLEKSIDLFRCVSEDYLHRLISSSPIIEIDNTNSNGEDVFLYEYGKHADYFTIILTGRVEVLSGIDKFASELGMWNYLGLRALTERSFSPDFTARVNKSVLFMKISHKDYIDMVTKAYRNNEHLYLPGGLEWIAKNERTTHHLSSGITRSSEPIDPKLSHSQIQVANVTLESQDSTDENETFTKLLLSEYKEKK